MTSEAESETVVPQTETGTQPGTYASMRDDEARSESVENAANITRSPWISKWLTHRGKSTSSMALGVGAS
eukprot:3869579-Karenia_brevis.AAC.1